MCGQMGVRQMAGTEGKIIGPPAESEYAVEPVGVQMMSHFHLSYQKNRKLAKSQSIFRASDTIKRDKKRQTYLHHE
jgi:hypothetical protein